MAKSSGDNSVPRNAITMSCAPSSDIKLIGVCHVVVKIVKMIMLCIDMTSYSNYKPKLASLSILPAYVDAFSIKIKHYRLWPGKLRPPVI